MEEDSTPVIIDMGSAITRAGLSIYDNPKAVIPSVIGKPKVSDKVTMDQKDSYIGNEALAKKEILSLSYPIQDSYVQNWDDAEKIYQYLFYNMLSVDPSQHRVLLCEPPQCTRAVREKLTELMFEKFSVYELYLCSTSVLSLYANGNTTGLVIESGVSSTHVSPIYEGFALPQAYGRLGLGGDDITNYLISLMRERGQELPLSKEFEVANRIKETSCYVSGDYQTDINNADSFMGHRTYELPDGSSIPLGAEMFRSPEILFQPQLLERDEVGIHEMSYSCIMKCDPDIRKELYGSIVLTGGDTMFPNIRERVTKDIRALAPSNIDTLVEAPPGRRNLAWLGGAMLSQLLAGEMWIKRREYDTSGPSIVHRKCFL